MMKDDTSKKTCDYPSTEKYNNLHRAITEDSIKNAVISWHVNAKIYNSFFHKVVSIVSIGEIMSDAMRDEIDNDIIKELATYKQNINGDKHG